MLTTKDYFNYLTLNLTGEFDIDISFENLEEELIKMAYEDRIEIVPDIEECIMPDSLQDYYNKTRCSVENLVELCKEILKDKDEIGFIRMPYAYSECDDDYSAVFSTNEKYLMTAARNIIYGTWIVDTIDDLRNDGEELERVLFNEDPIESSGLGTKVLNIYKKMYLKYELYDIGNHLKSINQEGFKTWYEKAKMLQMNKEISFFDIMMDTIVEFLSKSNAKLIFKPNYEGYFYPSKLPIGTDFLVYQIAGYNGMLKYQKDKEYNSKCIDDKKMCIEILNFAIERAGIQDIIEVTSDEDMITYKNKNFI